MCIVCVLVRDLLSRFLVTPRHRCVMMHEVDAYKDKFLPWSQRFFFIFHCMRELQESREATRDSRLACAASQLSHAVKDKEKPLGPG